MSDDTATCPCCKKSRTRNYGVQLPTARAWEKWLDARGLNANRALRQLIATALISGNEQQQRGA